MNAGNNNAVHDISRHYKTTTTYNYCTYLNSGLLEAPLKYILHGLVPSSN
jgi:hypothetical protein